LDEKLWIKVIQQKEQLERKLNDRYLLASFDQLLESAYQGGNSIVFSRKLSTDYTIFVQDY
jgi:hypothetical protein